MTFSEKPNQISNIQATEHWNSLKTNNREFSKAQGEFESDPLSAIMLSRVQGQSMDGHVLTKAQVCVFT